MNNYELRNLVKDKTCYKSKQGTFAFNENNSMVNDDSAIANIFNRVFL